MQSKSSAGAALVTSIEAFDLEGATNYHYGRFPPSNIDYARLARKISSASAALARYDGVLRSLHRSDILLAPLRRQEAVISSRIEGTIATLDEVLKYEADEIDPTSDETRNRSYRHETIEVFSYTRALNFAHNEMLAGLPICSRLLKSAHSKLLFFGRGADKQPGHFKKEQNYVVDQRKRKVLFIPIEPRTLEEGIKQYELFVNNDDLEPLTQTALAHLEFEALHPFKDGNGRIGRMFITLMLWNKGLISAPHFYISGHLEQKRDEYISRMREASQSDAWTEWCLFFLEAVEAQAAENLRKAESIQNLYEEMKEIFRLTLSSQWTINALDYIFSKPVFRNVSFTSESGIPKATAVRFTPLLVEKGLLTVVDPPSGRRSAIYAFEPLLALVRV